MDNESKQVQANPVPQEPAGTPEEQSLHSTEPTDEPVVEETPVVEPVPEQTVPVELNEETEEHEGPRWLVLGSLLLLAAAVGVGLYFGIRTIYRSAHHAPGQNVQPASNHVPQVPQSGQAANGANGPSRAGVNNSTSNPTNSTTPPAASSNSAASNSTALNSAANSTNPPAATNSTANNTTTAGKPLPNSGPGDVLALFAGAALIAGSVHYVIQARKASH